MSHTRSERFSLFGLRIRFKVIPIHGRTGDGCKQCQYATQDSLNQSDPLSGVLFWRQIHARTRMSCEPLSLLQIRNQNPLSLREARFLVELFIDCTVLVRVLPMQIVQYYPCNVTNSGQEASLRLEPNLFRLVSKLEILAGN